MSSDQKYGALLLVIGLVVAVFYVAIFIGDYMGLALFKTLVWWAVALPVILAVLAVLTIVAWIGWTMLTTPPLDIDALESTAESETS